MSNREGRRNKSQDESKLSSTAQNARNARNARDEVSSSRQGAEDRAQRASGNVQNEFASERDDQSRHAPGQENDDQFSSRQDGDRARQRNERARRPAQQGE